MLKKLLPLIILFVLLMSCIQNRKESVLQEDCGDCASELNEALEHMDSE